MKKYYGDYEARILKERNLKQNNNYLFKNMKEFNNIKDENVYDIPKSIINNNTNHNYLHQTFSSKSKMKKSKSFKRNKQLNSKKSNFNNKLGNKSDLHANNIKKELIKKDIINNNLEYNEYQKRIATISSNNFSNINKNFNSNKDKKSYFTMQNFYKNYPIPEPIPKKINYDINKNANNENENMFNCIKEDKNILYLLSNLNLEKLYNIFISNYISFNDLFLLTKEDFAEMKIPIGPRNRILHFIYEYKKCAKSFDFKELSSFLIDYKKMLAKPLMNDINNNGLVISTNNINNGPFNCFNSPIINNFLNNQNNEEIGMKKENIEKINIFFDNKDNEQNIIKNKDYENLNIGDNYSKDRNNDLTKLIIESKDKKYSNTTNTKLKKYNSINSSKKSILSNFSIKKFGFSENNKNTNIHTNYLNVKMKNKNNNLKTLSSKNLKNNFIKDENSKVHESSNNIHNKFGLISRRYNKNILLKNCNNSNYLLEKFKNIDKEVTKFQKNYTKIQKNARNIDKRLSYIFISQKHSQINENIIGLMDKDLEKENIRNLNYELNRNYLKNN